MRRLLTGLACFAFLTISVTALYIGWNYHTKSERDAMCKRYGDALTLATSDRTSLDGPTAGLTADDAEQVRQLKAGIATIAKDYQDGLLYGLKVGPLTPNQQYDVAEARLHAAALARRGC